MIETFERFLVMQKKH